MKKRILFVDDEPNVLSGLQRMLRYMRDEWDMVFLEGGKQALVEMAKQEFDVVISDMRMPGMNGAQLLREVMARYPATVRIVLSGHAERELVAQCVGVAHQYISKPCDPAELKTLIQNATLMGSGLVDASVKRIVGTVERLPAVPHLFKALTEVVVDQEASSQDVASIIEQDTGMTAHILKLVNSAFFGLRRSIESVGEAVTFLGFDNIKSLVLADAAFGTSAELRTRSLSVAKLWKHSLMVANGARYLAQQNGLSRIEENEAFVGGVLHDIGILVLATNFPERYDAILEMVHEEKLGLPTAELWELGVTHSEVGAYLLGIWGIPSPILKIASLHHRPKEGWEQRFSPLIAVYAADAYTRGDDACGEFGFNEGDGRLLEGMGFGMDLENWNRGLTSLFNLWNPEAP